MSTEKTENLVVLILRVIAIYFAIQNINLIPTWVSTFTMMFMSANQMFLFVILGVFLFLASFILPIIIWCASSKLGKLVVGNRRFPDFFIVDRVDFTYLIFTATGFLIFILVSPELLIWICQTLIAIFKTRPGFEMQGPSFWIFLILLLKVILSLILIFKGYKITNLIQRFRALEAKDESLQVEETNTKSENSNE